MLVDLEYLGHPGAIGVPIIDTADGLVLVDCGPALTLPRLRRAIEGLGATFQDVRAVLVTHIHLDHSGAAGALLEASPQARVYVHDVGAPHLVDPSRLLRSATMIYGEERMLPLWGETRPVPSDAITIIDESTRVTFGSHTLLAHATPGHARHHLAWLDEGTGTAFTGDVVGEQFPGSPRAIPVTPPPDINVEEMVASGQAILAWRAARLVPTHFGVVDDATTFIHEHEVRLLHWAELVRRSLENGRPEADLAAEHALVVRAELESVLPAAAHPWVRDEMLRSNWDGLARYWRRKARKG